MPSRSLTIEQVLALLAETPPAPRSTHRRSGASPIAQRPQRRRVVRKRCARPPPRVRRRLGRLHRDDHRRGAADTAGRQSPHLDHADGLSRAGIPALVARLRRAARRAPGGPRTAAARRLVTRGDGDGGGQGARADRDCSMRGGWPSTNGRTSSRSHASRQHDARGATTTPGLVMMSEAYPGLVDDRYGRDPELHELSPLDASRSRAKSRRRTGRPGS